MQTPFNGCISYESGIFHELHEVQLYPEGDTRPLSACAELSFLSFVDRTRIPLHISCGGRYEVILKQKPPATSVLLTTLLAGLEDCKDLQDDELDASSLAALIRFQDGSAVPKHGESQSPRITELLVYASRGLDVSSGSETPPASPLKNGLSDRTVVRFYAIPLSSDLLYQPALYQLPPTPPPEQDTSHIIGTFLQLPDHSDSRKRQRLNDLFDDATKARKKPVRQQSQDLTRMIPPRPESALLQQESRSRPVKQSHSRKSSLSHCQEDRPRSRAGPALERARSSLSRVASSGVLSRPSSQAGESTPVPDPSEVKNKKMLSNIVMASMRLRGMTQARNDTSIVPDDNEYKVMYHNTYKAANFALRNKMAGELKAESMRDVVDLLLDLFCGGGSESFDVSHVDGFPT